MNAPYSRARAIAGYILLAAAIVVAVTGIIRSAWLCDDVYITLRTVDNFVHGYGLRWNVDERVQTYTHPLWMFMLTLVYVFTREPYFTTLIVSFACATLGLCVLGGVLGRARLGGVLAVLTACASHAFIDYSTSGLENPLSNLLLTLFAWRFFGRNKGKRPLTWLCLCAALLMLNRSDYLLLVGPAVAWAFLSQRSRQSLIDAAIGFAPLIAWELFSFFYYGSLVPNTAYAKLHHAIPHSIVLEQGLRWAWFTMSLDWVTAGAIVAAVAGALWRRDRAGLAFVSGSVCYVAYSVWIGGDFMGGRFWLAPFMLSLCYLARCPLLSSSLAMAALLASTWFLPLRTSSYGGNPRVALGYRHGVWDERHSYFDALGLVNVGWDATGPLHEWARWGIEEAHSKPVTVRSAVGMHGFYAGPKLHIIDDLALCDPLLARLKPLTRNEIPVGHFKRHLPAGYFDSVLGVNEIVDPNLHEYYDHVMFVTRGPLFSPRRLWQSFRLITGGYNKLLNAYEDAIEDAETDVDKLHIMANVTEGPECTRCVTFYHSEDFRIRDLFTGAVECHLIADRDRQYHTRWLPNGIELARFDIGPVDENHGLFSYKLTMPRDITARGFNQVRIEAINGPPPYSFGGISCTTAAELP